MFEATLEAQGLNAGENRVRSLSTAVVAHAGLIGAIVFVTAMIVPPVKGPGLPIDPVRVFFDPNIGKANEPHDAPPPVNRRRTTAEAKPDTPVQPKPIEQPKDTPNDAVQLTPPQDVTGSEGPPGEGDPNGTDDGDPRGVLGGTGKPGGGDGDGDGDGSSDIGPLKFTGDMIRPVLVTRVEPMYPDSARKARLPGRVVLEAVIGLDGSVESVSVISSSSSLFNDAAMSAVRRWKYTPALMNGSPVRVYYTVQVSFVLR